MENRGSFGAGVLGDVSALRAALDDRGLSTSILDQVSPAAPTGDSNVSPGIPQTNPTAALGQAPQPQTTQGPQPPPARSEEMSIALKALSQVAKTESKIAEQSLGIR